MIEEFCRPIVGRGGRKGRQTGQVLPVRPIRVADLSGDDDDDRSLWPKKHPRPRPKARTASLDANMQRVVLVDDWRSGILTAARFRNSANLPMARSTLLSLIGALGFYHRRVFLPVLTRAFANFSLLSLLSRRCDPSRFWRFH